MKHGLIILGIVLIGIGILLGRWSMSKPMLQVVPPNIPAITKTPFNLEQPPPDIPEGPFRVSRVIDGDTIELENREKVRYIGIDTPESVDPRKPVQCFGVEATRKNKELVEGEVVWLARDVSDRDRYGRLLRYVDVVDYRTEKETFVNLELVRQGYAYALTIPPDVKHQEQLLAAQREAQENNLGLWSSCPVTIPTNSSQRSSPTLSLSPSLTADECFIKGNISSSGEKIFHLPGCGSYEKTQIDEGRGEKWFCSEDEAASAGWRKAKNC